MVNYRDISRLWQEPAALLLHVPKDGDPRQLLHEGKLSDVLTFIETRPELDRGKLTIALPDRHVPPTTVNAEGIEAMLGHPTRPGFSWRR